MKKMKKKTIKFIEKNKNKKNKTIKLKQRGGNPLDYIGWLFIRLFRLVFNIRSPPEITSISQSSNRESSNRESSNGELPSTPPTTPTSTTIPAAQEKILKTLKKYTFEDRWKGYKTNSFHFDESGREIYNSGGQKTFEDAVEFLNETSSCKYVISLHGNITEKVLSRLFSGYSDDKKKRVLKILFDDDDKIKYHQCSSGSDSTPIIIFYKQEDIERLVERLKDPKLYYVPIINHINREYNGPSLYNGDESALKEIVRQYLNAVSVDNLLKNSCIWKTPETINELMNLVVTKIMFGSVVSDTTKLQCGWFSQREDELIRL